ncbi:sulfatase [Flavicella sp.]|uniref:sulfatase n=1 Tax=Flavicella sp. TaxID=2957742 RepID=UPI00260B0EC8|nr:sulfatase [Flavicella sp.]MDG1806108.1 sulfatase [Flavicella sp.]
MNSNTIISKVILNVIFCALFVSKTISQNKIPPNVVFIMCDDLNDYQGVFKGHKQVITPNIDELAASGVQFLNAQSNAPVCQPSRNSIFTGVYPHDSGDFGWTPMQKQKVLKNNKTIIQLFKENGYYTLGSGKLTHGKPTKDWMQWGMKHAHNYGPFYNNGTKNGANPSVPAPYNSIGPIDGSYGRLSDAGISLGEYKKPGWVMGWDMKPMRYINDADRDLLQDEKHAKWAVENFAQLEKREKQQPFFMGIGFVRPHTPLHAPDKYFDMYPLDKIELNDWIPNDKQDTFWDENFSQKLKGPKYYKLLVESYDGDRELALKTFLQAYLACVTFVDEQVGKVMEALNKSKFANNTIVVFTSDHGWQMGEKNYLFKNSPWEKSARVPLIIKTPNSDSGLQVAQPVSLVDLFPTLIDYCAIEGDHKKNKNGGNLGGHTLRPLLENTKGWKGPKGALTIVGNYGNKYPKLEQNYSYRTAQYRYILYRNGKEELYDHNKDPHEWKNIAEDNNYKKIKKQLKKEMLAILK